MKNEKQQAIELIDKFKFRVNPYVGSGMLSNTYDDDQILNESKACALITVQMIIDSNPSNIVGNMVFRNSEYWFRVRDEILNIKKEEIEFKA